MRRLILPLLLALGACASQPPAQVTPQLVIAPPAPKRPFLHDAIPLSALTCAAEPSGMAVKTSRQSAVFILDLKSAGRDCRRKLDGARAMIQSER